jgi:hypothetical protein
MRAMRAFGLSLLLLAAACRSRPAEAPKRLDELAGFLFEHLRDEDPAELEAGTANLLAWLQDHLDETLEGYEVQQLDPDVLNQLNPRDRSGEEIAGAAVGHRSTFRPRALVEPVVAAPQQEVFPESYDQHQRTFLTDLDCFLERSCDLLFTRNEVEASYALGLKTSTVSRAEYRWVDLPEGPALLHRTWLLEPAEVSLDWIAVNDQIYLGATLPWKRGSLRLGTTWISAEVLGGAVPEKTALNLMIEAMKTEGEDLDAYLAGED